MMETITEKRRCSYNKDWETIYHWVKPVQGDSQRVFCELCQSYFSVSHGGEYDVKRHSICDTHKKRVAQKEKTRSMDVFLLKPKEDCQTDMVTAAEITKVYHTVQHSQSYRSEDCGNKLAPVIFPDSEIAKKMSCVSVETCLRELKTPIVQLQSDKNTHMPFFSVDSDASNHGTTKLFPLSLRYRTPELGLKSKILDFYEDSNESSATIHCQITNKLKENDL